jgi:DNA-binding NtrC family response regulator
MSNEDLYYRLLQYAIKWARRDRRRRDVADVVEFAMSKWLDEHEEELPEI